MILFAYIYSSQISNCLLAVHYVLSCITGVQILREEDPYLVKFLIGIGIL